MTFFPKKASKQHHHSHGKYLRNFLYLTNFHLTCWRTLHTCPDDTPGEHNHADFYELVVVTGGSARHRLQNQYQRISPGSVLLIKPGLYHEYTEYNNLEIYNLLFGEEFLRYFLPDLTQLEGFQLIFNTKNLRNEEEGLRIQEEHFTEITKVLESMDALKSSQEPGTQTMLLSEFIRVFLLLAKYCQWTGLPRRGQHLPQLTGLMATLDRELAAGWSLEKMARRVAMSVSSFRQEFHRLTGQSPLAYLQQRRLEKGAEMLASHPSLSLQEIAARCGFHDVNYFSRQFLKYRGIRPTAYRKGHE